MILSELRGLGPLLGEEGRNMPIRIDDDILDEPLIRDLVLERVRQGEARGEARGMALGETRGESRGEVAMLRRLLEQKFGSLPAWALARLESASPGMLEVWGRQMLNGGSIEEVFRP